MRKGVYVLSLTAVRIMGRNILLVSRNDPIRAIGMTHSPEYAAPVTPRLSEVEEEVLREYKRLNSNLESVCPNSS